MGRFEMTIDDQGNISGFYWCRFASKASGPGCFINLDDIEDVREAEQAGVPITVWSAYTLLARD